MLSLHPKRNEMVCFSCDPAGESLPYLSHCNCRSLILKLLTSFMEVTLDVDWCSNSLWFHPSGCTVVMRDHFPSSCTFCPIIGATGCLSAALQTLSQLHTWQLKGQGENLSRAVFTSQVTSDSLSLWFNHMESEVSNSTVNHCGAAIITSSYSKAFKRFNIQFLVISHHIFQLK